MVPDEFITIDAESTSECREKASRFLAIAFPVSTREEAEHRLSEIRKEHFDATHHPFAYRIVGTELIERFSDDGEPSGTAGKPIMRAIEKLRYYNVCVVVVRWFGGTKLGTGGLMRAYGSAAAGVFQHSHSRKCVAVTPVVVRFQHTATNAVMHAVARFGARISSNRYGEDAAITVLLRQEQIEAFTSSIIEATSGAAAVDVGTERVII